MLHQHPTASSQQTKTLLDKAAGRTEHKHHLPEKCLGDNATSAAQPSAAHVTQTPYRASILPQPTIKPSGPDQESYSTSRDNTRHTATLEMTRPTHARHHPFFLGGLAQRGGGGPRQAHVHGGAPALRHTHILTGVRSEGRGQGVGREGERGNQIVGKETEGGSATNRKAGIS